MSCKHKIPDETCKEDSYSWSQTVGKAVHSFLVCESPAELTNTNWEWIHIGFYSKTILTAWFGVKKVYIGGNML